MQGNEFINILIAEDNDVSREMMAGIIRTQGYKVHGAIDGESAIKVIQERDIDMALVDVNMAPKGGFEFMKYLIAKGLKIPVVIITSDDSADMLMEATGLGAAQVLQKPIAPDRLLKTIDRILRRQGLNPAPLAVESHHLSFSPEDLMQKTIILAAENADARRGGPFAALVATKEGKILGTGASGMTSRVDPTAHAEVMAIRKTAEKLGTADLSEYVLYCSSQPTKIGEALIASVGIQKVYYGLSHTDLEKFSEHAAPSKPEYEQIGRDAALSMFKKAKRGF